MASSLAPFHQFRLLETMKNPVESLLEDDHALLGQLLTELDAELSKPNIARAFELLDLFWARLAVHIRAENLHLFPALANAPASLFTAKDPLPASEEVHKVLARLRSDHDFFMKELAREIKAMREIAGSPEAHLEELEVLRQRLANVRERLEAHNLLEEEQAYVWPSMLFDEQTSADLCDQLRHELENLPPRFA
jgi:iron-sulfur cluster repair protein YtfE (RIC family)